MNDAEALQILQDFAHAKPLRLQQAVSHIEARVLTLAQLAEMLREQVRAMQRADAAATCREAPDYTFPIHDTGAAGAPEYAKAFTLGSTNVSAVALLKPCGCPRTIVCSWDYGGHVIFSECAIADTTSDATLPASPGSRFDAGAG